ncbi:hypothetical protein [Halalkalicoccus sp. NIPERK01]|uniref:hypothetical protein n=1 Tax=Halalkalicoccus sp. NIPERK01 TaxID=3053469 RepID=UPI00256F668E|nr:hypothetical protein [Halalkalicoccus sp. NIPERK01]MDL5362918.1 hypothetical protein [Halalkalicoccus sp. NIPERK01]
MEPIVSTAETTAPDRRGRVPPLEPVRDGTADRTRGDPGHLSSEGTTALTREGGRG